MAVTEEAPELRESLDSCEPRLEEDLNRDLGRWGLFGWNFGRRERTSPLLGRNCLKASTVLQVMLAENGVETEIMKGYPFADEMSVRPRCRGSWHCLLKTKGGVIIDPTHQQFFGDAGVNVPVAETEGLLPEQKIALIRPGEEALFGQRFIKEARRLRENAPAHKRPILNVIPDEVIRDIWNPDHYIIRVPARVR